MKKWQHCSKTVGMIVRLVDSECDLQSSVFVATRNVKSKKA